MNSFCTHNVPTDCYCRWCREGGAPSPLVEPTAQEREARIAQIQAERETHRRDRVTGKTRWGSPRAWRVEGAKLQIAAIAQEAPAGLPEHAAANEAVEAYDAGKATDDELAAAISAFRVAAAATWPPAPVNAERAELDAELRAGAAIAAREAAKVAAARPRRRRSA